LDLPIIKSGADHDHIGRAISPARANDLSPNGCSRLCRTARIASESEIARAHRTAKSIGEADRFGSLCERNAGSRAGDIPGGVLRTQFVGKTRSDFAAERVEVELDVGPPFSKP